MDSDSTEKDKQLESITPEMIEAGSAVIKSYCDLGCYVNPRVARLVYEAMTSAIDEPAPIVHLFPVGGRKQRLLCRRWSSSSTQIQP